MSELRRLGRLGVAALIVAVPCAGMASTNPKCQEGAGPAKPSSTVTLVEDVTPAGPGAPRLEPGTAATMAELRRGVWTRAITAGEETKARAEAPRKKARSGIASRKSRRKPAPAKTKPESQPFTELLGADS
jgi:hypothetical protein